MKFEKLLQEISGLWGVLYPILIKGMFVFWFIPNVIKPDGTYHLILWKLIGAIIIILSWGTSLYNLNKFKNKEGVV